MFDFGMGEIILVGIVALIVIGPTDFPKVFRTMGQFTGKLRGMAREFSRAMNSAADEAGVSDIDKTLRAATNPLKAASQKVTDSANWGPATKKLSEEREAAKQKILERSAQFAEERKARAAEAEATATAEPAPPAPAKPAADPAPAAPAAAPKDSDA